VTQGVICLCSRGLVHSRTIKSAWRAIPRGWRPNWELLTTDDLPIPEAQTTITEEALKLDPSFIWYIEEDMGLPDGILIDMLSLAKPVVTADYPLARFDEELQQWIPVGRSVRRDANGKIWLTGMGCLLVRADIFRGINKPWFETWEVTREGGVHAIRMPYGGQDIWFSRGILNAGIEIAQVPTDCKHYRLKDPGSIQSNNGVHKVIEL
jgi:hypothetical protein